MGKSLRNWTLTRTVYDTVCFTGTKLTSYTVRCSHPDLPTLPIPSILKPRTTKLDDGSNREIALPFVVGNFKANVRVVGYFPPEVADFAIGRRVSEYDVLSDYSGGEDTDSEEFKRSWKSGKGAPEKVWEWRFALQVEDASSKAGKERMWLLVDNAAAQGLLDMDAAK
jgi:protection-of-telomeres protein 1